MRTLLELTMIGNLGKNSEIKVFNSGKTYLSFDVCHNDKWQSEHGLVERSTWVSCLYALSEKAIKDGKLNLEKGCAVMLRGNMSTNHYKNNNGVDCVGINMQVTSLNIIGKIEKKPEDAIPPAPMKKYNAETGDLLP